MIKFAICDDDYRDRDKIKQYIEEYASQRVPEYMVKEFESGELFLGSGYLPHVLFLDICMDKKDGIQIGKEIQKGKTPIIIIYTTNLKEKMAEAFNQIHSFGFLTKPIDKDDFFKMLEDALEKTTDTEYIHEVSFWAENNVHIQIPVMDILYFEYSDRRIRLVTKDRRDIYIKEKINVIADNMRQYGFMMTHQSFVVNLYYVDKFINQNVIMKNGDKVCLAQKRTSAVRKELMRLVKERVNHEE